MYVYIHYYLNEELERTIFEGVLFLGDITWCTGIVVQFALHDVSIHVWAWFAFVFALLEFDLVRLLRWCAFWCLSVPNHTSIQQHVQGEQVQVFMALFGTAYFQLLHKFKQKFCQTDSFCSSLSVQQLLKMN
jgi:hypothetical protein